MINSQLLFDIARVLLSVTFLVKGVKKIQQQGDYIEILRSKHIPLPELTLWLVIIVELFGGLSLLSGYIIETTAIVLFTFMIPATLIFHNFRGFSIQDKDIQMVHFIKNVGIWE